jgi:hypothetical protein
LAFLRSRPPNSAFPPDFFPKLLDHIQFSGIRSLLSQLIANYPEDFPNSLQILAFCLSNVVDELDNPNRNRQIIGLFSVLSFVFKEEEQSFILSDKIDWFTLVFQLVDATFEVVKFEKEIYRDGSQRGLFLPGIRMLSSVIERIEKEGTLPQFGDIQLYIETFSQRIYPKTIEEIQKLMGSVKKSDGMRLQFMIDVFQVVWFIGINVMSSLLFEDPGVKKNEKGEVLWIVTGEFRNAMFKRIEKMVMEGKNWEFVNWIHRNHIIEKFESAQKVAPTTGFGIVSVPLNPEVWKLAKLILEVKVVGKGEDPKLSPQENEVNIWDRMSRLIVKDLSMIVELRRVNE